MTDHERAKPDEGNQPGPGRVAPTEAGKPCLRIARLSAQMRRWVSLQEIFRAVGTVVRRRFTGGF